MHQSHPYMIPSVGAKCLRYCLLKIWPLLAYVLYFLFFIKINSKWMFKWIAHDWIQTWFLWYWKQPLKQTSNNHCPWSSLAEWDEGWWLPNCHLSYMNCLYYLATFKHISLPLGPIRASFHYLNSSMNCPCFYSIAPTYLPRKNLIDGQIKLHLSFLSLSPSHLHTYLRR